MRLVNLIGGIYLAILSQVSVGYGGNFCMWETISNSKSYTFNLVTSDKHAHGARSEDGLTGEYRTHDYSWLAYTHDHGNFIRRCRFYKVDGAGSMYWFQLCEHMQFNHDAPRCDNCESCGGPLHCGETCSALQATMIHGYPVCRTLGLGSNYTYSLINPDKPELGVVVKMTASGLKESCSFTVSIFCSLEKEQLPKVVTKDASGSCDYATMFYHSAGCPTVTSVKGHGMGWFGTIMIVLLCGLIVYFAVGIAYRVIVLGVSGLEAFPNLDFWKALPHNIQLGAETAVSYAIGCYRRFTEPTYVGVNH